MRCLTLILLAHALVFPARAQGTLVYDSSAPSYFYRDTLSAALDDGAFPADYQAPTTFDAVDFAFSVPSADGSATVVSFDAILSFYGAFNPAAPAGQAVNTGLAGSVTIPIRNFSAEPGVLYSAIDTVGTASYPLPAAISLPNPKWAVEVKFVDPVTKDPFTAAKVVFAGGRVSIGSNDAGYYADTNGNGLYEASERYIFSVFQLAHFYLRLFHTHGPTNPPQSLVALRVAAGVSACDATGPYSFASLNADTSGPSASAIDLQDVVALLKAGL